MYVIINHSCCWKKQIIKILQIQRHFLKFFLYSYRKWLTDGCRIQNSNETHTICECDHLTNFAVLMDVHGTQLSEGHQMALQIITYIGCIISIVCLILAIITFQLFRGLKVGLPNFSLFSFFSDAANFKGKKAHLIERVKNRLVKALSKNNNHLYGLSIFFAVRPNDHS